MSYSRHRSRSSQRKANSEALPPIAALFVVKFDQREGYKLVWSKSIPNIELEGVVDFKSLPSGLHNVKEDLVYFIHDRYAGISAFVNVPGDESQRNAQMLSVGALVPLSYGRLGKSWRHADGLHKLAEEHLSNSDRLRMLEEYWEKNRVREGDTEGDFGDDSLVSKDHLKSSPQVNGYRRPRAISDATATVTPNQTLSPHHPAISLPKLITEFGPLIYPLYRAALLRKRILMLGEPPVEQNCNFVYDLSILSSIPTSLLPLLPIDSIPPLRLRSLFNVGVQDIPILQLLPEHYQPDTTTTPPSVDFPPSWIACTTDDVLATKPQLYDLLVSLPQSPSASSSSNVIFPAAATTITTTATATATNKSTPQNRLPYPKIYPTSPTLSRAIPKHGLKATQRDLRRYLSLRSNLRSLPSAQPIPPSPFPKTPAPTTPPPVEGRDRTAPHPEDDSDAGGEDGESITSSSTASGSTFSRTSVIESTPWALIAYSSFMWWASAGEEKGGLGDEDEDGEEGWGRGLGLGGVDMEEEDGGDGDDGGLGLTKEMAIVGYFHRLTGLIFATVSDAISRVDGEGVRRGEGGGGKRHPIGGGDGSEGAEGLGFVPSKSRTNQQSGGGDEQEEEEDEDPTVSAPKDDADETQPLLSPSQTTTTTTADTNASDPPTEPVEITSTDMTQMGLDVWSSADRAFVEELVLLWWGRTAVVRGGRVECCGVRVL